MTTITVHDIPAMFGQFYVSEMSAKDRFAHIGPMLEDNNGLMRRAQMAAHTAQSAVAVMMAGGVEAGATLGQQGFGMFNPTRRPAVSAQIFDAFRDLRLLSIAREQLVHFAQAMPGPPAELEVFLFPADPANASQMTRAHGMAGHALAPGLLVAQIYPTPGGMGRFQAMLARWWAHQCWIGEHGAPTHLGEWLRMEAQAIAFVGRMVPGLPTPAWMAPFHPQPDWEATLQAVADAYGVASYSQMMVNTYGQSSQVGDARDPLPEPLDDDMRELVAAVLADALDETQAPDIAAYLYGDALVARQGFQGHGLPPYAGYAAIANGWLIDD